MQLNIVKVAIIDWDWPASSSCFQYWGLALVSTSRQRTDASLRRMSSCLNMSASVASPQLRAIICDCLIKPGTQWRQSWIQHGRLSSKSTVAETGNKSATKSTVADTVNFVAGFGNKSAAAWIRQFGAVDFVADTFNFVADGPIRSTLSPACTGPNRQSNTVDFVDLWQSRPC